jgi:hypothetical protein
MDFRSNEAGRTVSGNQFDFRDGQFNRAEPRQWQQELRR